MSRVGTCKDCGARFKIPDAVKAAAAKCSKCGGTVNIPPAEASPPAAPPVATPSEAPGRSATPSPRAPAGRTPPASSGAPQAASGRRPQAAGARTGTSTGTRSGRGTSSAKAEAGPATARGSRREREPRKEGDKPKGLPLVPIVGGVALVAAAIGGWLAFGGDDASRAPAGGVPSATTADSEDAVATDTATPVAAPAANPTEAAPLPAMEPAAAETAQAAAPAQILADAAPAAAPAPEPPPSGKPDVETPRDPVIAIAPLPPVPGTTEEQLAEWSALVRELYIEDPSPKVMKKLKAQLAELDIVDLTPAFVNAMIGLDMSNAIDIRNGGKLVDDWSHRQGRVLKFFFDLDASRVSQVDINKRVIVIEGWRTAFEKYTADPARLEKYRNDVAAALASSGGG